MLHHKEMEEFHNAVVDRQSKELKRAQSLKETKEQELLMVRKIFPIDIDGLAQN